MYQIWGQQLFLRIIKLKTLEIFQVNAFEGILSLSETSFNFIAFLLGIYQTFTENSYCSVPNVPENRAYLINSAVADLQIQRCFCSVPGSVLQIWLQAGAVPGSMYFRLLSAGASTHRIWMQNPVNWVWETHGSCLFVETCSVCFSVSLIIFLSYSAVPFYFNSEHSSANSALARSQGKASTQLWLNSWHKSPHFFFSFSFSFTGDLLKKVLREISWPAFGILSKILKHCSGEASLTPVHFLHLFYWVSLLPLSFMRKY